MRNTNAQHLTDIETITLDAFIEQYKPLSNPFLAAEVSEGFSNAYVETYGDELRYVMDVAKQKPRNVWTVIEEDGELYINNGFHFVNRLAYIITENEWPTHLIIIVKYEAQ
jgi:hypothetical protein